MAVVMILGYPASGKTSLRDKIKIDKTVVLNRDTEGGKIASLIPKLEQAIICEGDSICSKERSYAYQQSPFIRL